MARITMKEKLSGYYDDIKNKTVRKSDGSTRTMTAEDKAYRNGYLKRAQEHSDAYLSKTDPAKLKELQKKRKQKRDDYYTKHPEKRPTYTERPSNMQMLHEMKDDFYR